MRCAIIGDIHGNKYALESVLQAIETKDVDMILSTGDVVGYMPYPNEVIELLKKHKVIVVQGNHDLAIAQSEKVSTVAIEAMNDEAIQKKASAAFTNWALTDTNRMYLKNLSTKLIIECGEMKMMVVHGSPDRIDEYLYEDADKLSEVAKSMNVDILVCGHTHIPYYKKIGTKHIINAGSVGKPKHGNSMSSYIILEICEGLVTCEMEKVSYNVGQMIEDIAQNRMIANELIPMLKLGQ